MMDGIPVVGGQEQPLRMERIESGRGVMGKTAVSHATATSGPRSRNTEWVGRRARLWLARGGKLSRGRPAGGSAGFRYIQIPVWDLKINNLKI